MAVILTDAELAQLRLDVAGMLPQTAVISRATETVSSAGDPTKTWAAVGTATARLDPYTRGASGGYILGDQEEGRAYYQLSVPHDTDLRDGDRVAISAATYEVMQLHTGQALAAVKRAMLVRFGT